MQYTWKKNLTDPDSLKKFLEKNGVSHRMYQSLKTNGGRILLNAKNYAGQKLQNGDVVMVIFSDEISDPEVHASNGELRVVFEDNNWLIVDKPAGLNVVPGPANRIDTLVNRVKGHLISQHLKDLRPHVITRLDRFTSGLVLVAKNRLANSIANQMLAKHAIFKTYIAFVSGSNLPEQGRIKEPIEKDPNSFGQRVSVAGKFADTEYEVLKRQKNWVEVLVTLHTGRTHQIRVHFAYIEHPLLGDQLYGGPMDMGISRQALHANMIKFQDPFSGKKIALGSSLPADMKNLTS